MTMNGKTEENLRDLFEKFLNAGQAKQAAEDIQKGEQILRESAAPEPDDELIASIKFRVAASLLHKKENAFRRIVYKTAVIAAGFIILAIISVKLFEPKTVQPPKPVSNSIMPKAVWESECLADDGADSATLVADVEQVESDLLTLESGENGGNGEVLTELEMELTEINSDFWKG